MEIQTFEQLLAEIADLRDQGRCSKCAKQHTFEFTDDLSFKEYTISGLCQECQDDFFGPPEGY